MACTLDTSYIQNADPLILEKLKACKDFSDSQVAAMETQLLSAKTQYGYENQTKFKPFKLLLKVYSSDILHVFFLLSKSHEKIQTRS